MAGAALLFDLVSRDRASAGFLRVAGAADKTAASTARAERSLLGMSRSTLGMGVKIAGLAGGYEIFKKAIEIGKEASAFQQKMLMIKTSAGASSTEVKNMSKAVLGMAGSLGTGPEQLADALYHVEQNGLRGKKALEALQVGAQGAKIGMADVEDTTNTMTIAMASGISGVENLQKAMGFMIATVGTGDMRLKDLNEALSGGILSVAKGFGVSLRDVAAVLATLGDNGIRGADAATALRQTMMGFAAPAKGGADALRSVGLSMTDLQVAMEKHGLVYAMNDLEKHMKSAGVTGSKVGGFITNAFGRKAGAGIAVVMGEINRLNTKYAEAEKGARTFGERWAATKKTTAFVFASLSAEMTSFGIKLAQKALPPITQFAAEVGKVLPGAFRTAGGIIGPFANDVGTVLATAWHAAGVAFGIAAAALKPIASLLSAIKGPLGAIGTAAVGAWVAFKLFSGIPGILETAALKVMYAKDAVVGFGTSARATATSAVASMTAIGASSTAASDEVVASGAVARVGWAGLLGPLAAVGVGVGLLISMFHKSGGASKTAAQSIKNVTDAAKSYEDAVKSGSRTTLAGQIGENLIAKGLPGDLERLNKSLGQTRYSGKQFASAIQAGGKPLESLRAGLQQIVTANSPAKIDAMAKAFRRLHQGISGRLSDTDDKQLRANTDAMTARQKAAAAALGVLTDQYLGLSRAQKKEITDLKQLGIVSAPIEQVGAKLHLTGDEVKKYAGVLGLAVTKNGDLVDATKANEAAILHVANAYNTATQSGSEFLSALESFSSSTGSSADRAALIGSTLKAANGDALSFAGAMNASAVATHSFFTDVKSNAKSAKKSIGDYLGSLINLRTGTINYSKAGAGPLIQDLQGIQTAAMAAASATYQHARATKGGKQAADDAYKVYQSQTRGALMDEATQLGLTATQAKKLADKYFGMPKKVKTLIEQEGANPIVTVLNQIGTQLSFLTHHPWKPKVDVDDKASKPIHDIFNDLNSLPTTKTITIIGINDVGQAVHDAVNNIPSTATSNNHATGGAIHGPGTGTSDSIPARLSNGEYVINAKQTRKHRALLENINKGVQGFSTGGPVGNARDISSALSSAFKFTKAQIAGFLGNFKVESGLNPKAYNAKENAHGYAQWEGSRWTALQKYAKHMGEAATSSKAQIGFMVKELRGSGLVSQIKKMKDPAKVAAFVDKHYERSAGTTRAQREAAARQFARQGPSAAKGGSSGSGSASSSSAGHRRAGSGVGRITTGTLDGHEVWIFGGKKYASLRAAQNARASAVTKAEKAGASKVQGALGAVGQPAQRPFDINQVGYKRVRQQLAHVRVLLDNADLTPKARAALTKQYRNALALANKERHELRVKIRTTDLRAISKAVGGSADDIRASFTQLITDMRNEGASARQIARVQNREKATVAANNKYVAAKDYRSGIKSTLAGTFDATQYGSTTDLIAGLSGQTSQNNAYAKELNGLRSKAKGNKTLTAFINQLAESGQTATLQSLAGASKGDLAQVTKSLGAYNSSLNAGADAATKEKFDGKTAAQLHEDVDRMIQHTDKMVADMVGAVGHLGHTAGTLHNHASAQTKQQLEHAMNRMAALSKHGRKTHP